MWYERLGLTKKQVKKCGLGKRAVRDLGEEGLASIIGYCENRLWGVATSDGRYTGVETLDLVGLGYSFS